MRVRPIVIAWAKEKISANLVCQKRKDRPTWTGNGTPVQLNVDFLTGMSEANQAAGHSRHRIALIVHPREVGNLRVKERGPGFIPNPRSAESNTPNRCPRREVKLHEHCIELRERSAQGVTNLCHKGVRYGVPKRCGNDLQGLYGLKSARPSTV